MPSSAAALSIAAGPSTEMRTLSFLNMSGHSTLTWSPANDELMRALIEKKMNAGFTFFVLKKRRISVLPDKRVKVTDIRQAMDARNLSMDDEDFAKIIAETGIQLVHSPANPQPLRDGDAVMTRDPALVASGHSVGVRSHTGG